jgi:hypothetical protein
MIPDRVPINPARRVKPRMKALFCQTQAQNNHILRQNGIPRSIEIRQ